MPKSIFVDLNIIMDVLLARRGFKTSQRIIELWEQGSHQLYISAHMVTTFAYLLEEAGVPRREIRNKIDWLLKSFDVDPVGHELLRTALSSDIADYEDAVVVGAANNCNATAIITRNIKDFKSSSIQAVTPEQYLAELT